MKFGQVIEYNKTNVFLEKSWRKNEVRRLNPDLLFFLKKSLYEIATGLHFTFNIY